MWTELIGDVKAAYKKGGNEHKLQAQQLVDATALIEKNQKDLATSKALAREYLK